LVKFALIDAKRTPMTANTPERRDAAEKEPAQGKHGYHMLVKASRRAWLTMQMG
jgi:hypothetical protein